MNYKSYVKAMPANILQNGLGQAMATELAANKGEDAHRKLYEAIQSWLCCKDNHNAPYPGENDLVGAIMEGDQRKYIQAQTEAMLYLDWLKKFAVAYLPNE